MKVFDFDPVALAGTYQAQQWLHVRRGVTAEFLEYAREVVRASGALDAVQGSAIQGAKQQYVFEFPPGMDLFREVHEPVGLLWGIDPATIVLSERHIKAYHADADPWPDPHKDRYASGIAVGLTLDITEGSHVVLYPDDDLSPNLHLTADLRDSLTPEEQPGVTLQGAREVEIHDQPGDVLAFPGASRWHLRRNSASTVLLYLKFDDFDADPLGEDPTTDQRRQQSMELVADDDRLLGAVPVLSRRFDTVGRETGRGAGRELWHLNVWEGTERRALAVPAPYAHLVSELDGRDTATVRDLADQGCASLRGGAMVTAVRNLVQRGALDLLPSSS